MTRVLVDTNIIIDYLRAGIDTFTDLVELQKKGKIELFLSSMSILELYCGKSSKIHSDKIFQLVDLLTVIPLNSAVAKLAGEIQRDNNLTIAVSDLVIAASALSIHAKLATRNKRLFHGIPKLQFAV